MWDKINTYLYEMFVGNKRWQATLKLGHVGLGGFWMVYHGKLKK